MNFLATRILLVGLICFLVFSDEVIDHVDVDIEQNIRVGIILHNFEDEDLVVLEGFAVAVDQEAEEVQQF